MESESLVRVVPLLSEGERWRMSIRLGVSKRRS